MGYMQFPLLSDLKRFNLYQTLHVNTILRLLVYNLMLVWLGPGAAPPKELGGGEVIHFHHF